MSGPAPNPFKGLESYGRDDYPRLFGRDADFLFMKDRIFAARTTLMFAGSGVGKTSFFEAKLIPELEQRHPGRFCIRYHREWPAADPLGALKKSIGADPSESLLQFFQRQPGQWIVILDQFEELFQNPDYYSGSLEFREQVAAVVNSSLPVRVVFSMREEFLGNLSFFDNHIPDLFANYYRLKNPEPPAAEDIVRRTCAPVAVDDAGLRQLVQDLSKVEIRAAGSQVRHVSRESVFLPYLQLVCQRLWDAQPSADGEFKFLSDYAARQAALDPSTSPAADILEQFCKDQLQHLSGRQQRIAARALDYLVASQGAKRAYSSTDLARLMRLRHDDLLQGTLQRLQSSHILRSWKRQDQDWYELYHDMYAPILYRWKEAYQERRRKRTRWGVVCALLVAAVAAVVAVLFYNFYLSEKSLVGAEKFLTRARSFDERAAYAELQGSRDEAVVLRLAALAVSPSAERRRAAARVAFNPKQLLFTFRHDSPVVALAFTRDGKLAVTASGGSGASPTTDPDAPNGSTADRTSLPGFVVRAWEVDSGRVAANFWNIPERPDRIALSLDKATLVTVGISEPRADGSRGNAVSRVQIWTAAGPVRSGPVTIQKCAVETIDFAPDGKRLLVTCRAGPLVTWTAFDKNSVTARPTEGSYSAVDFSPDGRFAVTGDRQGAVQLWNTATGRRIGPPLQHGGAVTRIAFHADGNVFAVASQDSTARVWTVGGTPIGPPLIHAGPVRRVAFAGSRVLMTLSDDPSNSATNRVYVFRQWDPAAGKPIGEPVRIAGANTPIWALLRDGKSALQRFSLGSLMLYDVAGGRPLDHPLDWETIRSYRVSPNGQFVLTCDRSGVARLWVPTAGSAFSSLEPGVGDAVVDPEGSRFAVLESEGTIRVASTIPGMDRSRRFDAGAPVTAFALSPGANRLAAAGRGFAQVWDLVSGKFAKVPLDPQEAPRKIAFSEDGQLVLVGSDSSLISWDGAAGPLHRTAVPNSVDAFSPTGAYALSLKGDSLTLIRTATGAAMTLHRTIPSPGAKVSFSPDDRYVACAGAEGGVAEVFTIATGRMVLLWHEARVDASTFSPDSSLLATQAAGKLRIWNWRTMKVVAQYQIQGQIREIAFNRNQTGVLVATPSWVHWLSFDGSVLTPRVSRQLHGAWTGAYWLDPAGAALRTILRVTRGYVRPEIVDFGDDPNAPQIEGDPRELVRLWQKKLDLHVEGDEVVPTTVVRAAASTQ